MTRIIAVRILGDYRLELTFDDGVVGTVDLNDLAGIGVFAIWGNLAPLAGFASVPPGNLRGVIR